MERFVCFEEFIFDLEEEDERLVELVPVFGVVFYYAVTLGDFVVVRGVDIDHIIIIVKAVYFVAILVLNETIPIICLPEAA